MVGSRTGMGGSPVIHTELFSAVEAQTRLVRRRGQAPMGSCCAASPDWRSGSWGGNLWISINHWYLYNWLCLSLLLIHLYVICIEIDFVKLLEWCWLFLLYMSIDNFVWGIERLHGAWYMAHTQTFGCRWASSATWKAFRIIRLGPRFSCPKKTYTFNLAFFGMHPYVIPIWSCTTPNCRFSKVSISLSIGFKNT